MMNVFHILAASLLSLSLAAQEAPHLRIGSWNLEWFGGPPAMRSVHLEGGKRSELPPRDEQDLAEMARFVRELGVAVLAVQEIGSEDALRKMAKQIGPKWNVVLGTTGGFAEGKTLQAVGFCYDDARVDLLWAEEMLDFPREKDGLPIFHRVPVTACFKDRQTGLDFRAVVLHLKAGDKADDKKKRAFEAQGIRDWLVTLQSSSDEDQDIVVLGDFNSTYGTEVQQTLEASGVARYLPQLKSEPTIMHFDEPIDQIAPSPRFLEVQANSFDSHSEAALPDKAAWRKTHSDHYPVTVSLTNGGDDDPQATFSRGKREHRLPASARSQQEAATDVKAQTPRARSDEAFAAGVAVRLLVNDERSHYVIEGTLLSGLSEWVKIRDLSGMIRAFPASAIREVQRR